MSVNNGIHNQFDPSERPIFLDIAPGMTVIVRHNYLTGEKRDKDWWMGQVIHCGGSARDPKIHNLFQIADVDSGAIRWVNADLVSHVVTDPKTDCGHTGAMKRINPIAAIAAASILLVGCLEGKGLTKKQKPWATPKGDARVDCGEFKALDEHWSSAHKRAHKEHKNLMQNMF